MNKRFLFLIGCFLIFIFLNTVSATLNVSLSDQGTDVKDKSTGNILTSGDLSITIYDALSGGNLIYNETFVGAIVNGSWNVMLGENSSNPLSLEFGKVYYKDYAINGSDLDFIDFQGNTVERQFFYSPLGDIAGEDISITANLTIANLTLSQKITFAFGEIIDNIIDDWVRITGGLNVTENIQVGGNVTANYFIGNGSQLTGISGASPEGTEGAIQFYDGGSFDGNASQFFINKSSGNVGIGTDSPDSILHLKHADPHITLESTGAGDASYGYFIVKDSGGNTMGFAGFDSGSNSDFTIRTLNVSDGIDFQTNGSNSRLYINQAGYVGIGTTSPAGKLEIFTDTEAANPLNFNFTADGAGGPQVTMYRSRAGMTSVESDDVIGNVRVTGYNGSEYISFSNIQWRAEEVSNGVMNSSLRLALVHQNAQTEIMRLLSNGNVGIGTTNPDEHLHIYGDGTQRLKIESSDGSAAVLKLISTNSSYAWVAKGSGIFALYDYNATEDRITIDENGSIGIGDTITPQAKLEVVYTTTPTEVLRNTVDASYSSLRLYNDQNAALRALEIDYSGSAYASALVTGGPVGESASLTTTGAYPLTLGTDNTMRMTINGTTGNVGIGTTSPDSDLEVYTGPSNDARGIVLSQGGGNSGRLFFVNGTSGSGNAILKVGNDLQFTIGATPGSSSGTGKIFLQDDGNVGIGTSSPGALLDVDGSVTLGSGSSSTGSSSFAAGSYASASGTGAISLGRSTNAGGYGSVAMGGYSTATTSAKYGIAIGYYAKASEEYAIAMGREMNVSGLSSFGISLNDPSSDYKVTENSVMAIMGGNVGIGTVSPDYKLEIAGTGTYAESDAIIELYRNAATSNGNYVGTLRFTGKDSAATEQSYVKVAGIAEQTTSGSERGGIKFLLMGNDPGLMDEAFRFHYDGTAEAEVAWNTFSPYLVMQYIPEDAKKEDYEIGDIVIIKNRKVLLSTESYQTNVLGVIVPREGFISTPKDWKNKQWDQEKSLDEFPGVPVAYIGDVKVKVSTESGPIESGDPLVSSSIPGVGMKGEPNDFKQYSGVIGKAREPFNEEGIGLIEVALGVK